MSWHLYSPATTGEHMTRSDLRSAFGIPTQSHPLYLHDAERANRRVGSLDAKVLKSPGRAVTTLAPSRTIGHGRGYRRHCKPEHPR
jgi:hypothetical protein